MLVLHHPSAPSLGLGVFKATPVDLNGKAEEGGGPIFILGTIDGDNGTFSAVATWAAETDVRPAIDLLYKKAAVTNSFFELEDGSEDEKKLAAVVFYLRELDEMGYEPISHESKGIPFD